jgi:ribosomal protein S18 acetylase RimI-like enzyme
MKLGVTNVQFLMESLKFFTMVKGGEVVGSIGYAAPHQVESRVFPKEWAHIRLLAVHPDARGRGIARDLTMHVIERAKQDSAAVIGLHTSTLMTSARRLYYGLGFQQDGMSFELFGVRYDRLVLNLK